MLAFAGFPQQVIGAAADDIGAVLDEALDDVDDAQFARLAVDDGQHDDAEVHLHLRLLVQVVQDDFGVLAALQFEDDAHAVAIAFVARVGDAFNLLVADERSYVLDEAGFVDLEGNLRDDDRLRDLCPSFSVAALARILRLPRPRR